jgi:hypothetical protein
LEKRGQGKRSKEYHPEMKIEKQNAEIKIRE